MFSGCTRFFILFEPTFFFNPYALTLRSDRSRLLCTLMGMLHIFESSITNAFMCQKSLATEGKIQVVYE